MEQLLREFLAGAEDLIEGLFADIRALREKQGDGPARRELTGRLFRHLHTLKGTAAAAGLETTSRVAHEFETLLDGVRQGRVALSSSVLDAFDDATQALSETLRLAASGAPQQTPLPLFKQLQHLARGGADDPQLPAQPASAALAAQLPEELTRSLSAESLRRLYEAAGEGLRLFVVHIAFELESFDHRFRELSAALGHSGELISTQPAVTEAAPGAISFQLLYATAIAAQELTALVAPFGAATLEELPIEAAAHGAEVADRRGAEAEDGRDEKKAADTAAAEVIAPPVVPVRIELVKLDELISMVQELVAETGAALTHAGQEPDAVRLLGESSAASIHRRLLILEERLTGLQRVPLAQTLELGARAGRQVARATGKEVTIEIEGADVRLDVRLVRALSDALLHLVRNAVDHGLETPAERELAGKNARGTVRLEAFTESRRVILRVTDDGRGIDLERVARAAIERGLIETGRSLSHEQALRLIFRPGFSTAPVVSEVSGRGVGLEVVARAIEQAGGEMCVRSETGQGTVFELIVPTAPA